MNFPSFERARTMGLLHRFFRTALLVGRMPSLIGREVFRTNMRSTPARALEDAVVFVCDIERVLRTLATNDQRLIAFCVLEDHSEWEAARVFHCGQKEASRRLAEVLDLLHETFCRLGFLPRPVHNPPPENQTPIPRPRRRGEKHEKQSEWQDAGQVSNSDG